MKKDVLCETCNFWVDCTREDNKPHGFCICRDLFTYTYETRCKDYAKGTPISEDDFENWGKK